MFFIKDRKESNVIQEVPAIRMIVDRWMKYKQRLALFLQRKSEQLSAGKKKMYLLFFCLVFGGGSIVLAINTFLQHDERTGIVKTSKVFKTHTFQKRSGSDSIITKKEYERSKNYKDYILGLNETKEGQNLFDSLLSARPKLLDSIALFENIYLSQ